MRRVLVVGGGFAGLCCGRDLANHFLVTIVDAKEFFEYTPGVLRAYTKPKHLDALTFTLQPVIEAKMGCKYIWGEVTNLNGENRTCTIKPMFTDSEETIDFDYCIIASGCNFGPFHKWGESLWFPTIHRNGRAEGSWPHLDERFLEGRRRHILEEYGTLQTLNQKEATVLIVGAGFIGVEWVTELQYFFPKLKLTIIDGLDQCLGPLPKKAAVYCEKYMRKKKINCFFSTFFKPDEQKFWDDIKLPNRPDKQYVCIGVKASNYFMPKETLSEKGPGGGGWVLIEKSLAVKTRENKTWSVGDRGYPRIYAIGDCNYGCVEEAGKKPGEWPIPPIPKISYPGEEQAIIACRNIVKIDHLLYMSKTSECCGVGLVPNMKICGCPPCKGVGTFCEHLIGGVPMTVHDMHWPWGAGMFATSLGPDDACFVIAANWEKGSGCMVNWGQLASVQKEIIEASKVNECRYSFIGLAIWHFVHHTPVHLWGGGPRFGY